MGAKHVSASRIELTQTPLPDHVSEELRYLPGKNGNPRTLAEVSAAIEQVLDGESVDITEFFLDKPGATVLNTTNGYKYTGCLFEALVAAVALEDPVVKIRSQSTEYEDEINIQITNGDLAVTPETAVFSWAPSLDDANCGKVCVLNACSHIHAFRDKSGYLKWHDETADSNTMMMDAATMYAFAKEVAHRVGLK
jgi:hypothetical protein